MTRTTQVVVVLVGLILVTGQFGVQADPAPGREPATVRFEVPMDAAQEQWRTAELGGQVCDGVSLNLLSLRMAEVGAGDVDVTVAARLYTRPPEDKQVRLTLALVNDDTGLMFFRRHGGYRAKYLGTPEPGWTSFFGLDEIDTRPAAVRHKTVTFTVDRQSLDAVLGGSNPRLVVTLRVDGS